MLHLTNNQKEVVFRTIRSSFTDFLHFNDLMTGPLQRMIDESENIEFTYVTSSRLVEYLFDVKEYQHPQKKYILHDITMIMKACLVLLFSYHPHARRFMFQSTEELLHYYPQFAECDSQELALLLKFRNIMRTAILLIPARQNKHMLLKIVGRLEGAHRDYIMGGGQRKEVDRRVAIFHQESGLPEQKRPMKRSGVCTIATAEQINLSAQKRAASSSWQNLFAMVKIARNTDDESLITESLTVHSTQSTLTSTCDSLSSSSDGADFDFERVDSASSVHISDMEVSDVLFHDTLVQELHEPDVALIAAGERGYSLDTEFKNFCSVLESDCA